MRGERFMARSVKAFGAVGDGAADDTLAIRSAIVAGDGFGDHGVVKIALVAGVGLVVLKLLAAGVTHGGAR